MYTCMSATCNTSIQDFDLLYTEVSSWNPNADWIQTKVGIGGKYNADELNSKYRLKNGYSPSYHWNPKNKAISAVM